MPGKISQLSIDCCVRLCALPDSYLWEINVGNATRKCCNSGKKVKQFSGWTLINFHWTVAITAYPGVKHWCSIIILDIEQTSGATMAMAFAGVALLYIAALLGQVRNIPEQ